MLRITCCLLALASVGCSAEWRPLPHAVVPAALCGGEEPPVWPLSDWVSEMDAVVVAKVESIAAISGNELLQMEDCPRPIGSKLLVMKMNLERVLTGESPNASFYTADAFTQLMVPRAVPEESGRVHWELGCNPEDTPECTPDLMEREIRPGQLLGLGLKYGGPNVYFSQRFSLPPDGNLSFPAAFPRNECVSPIEFDGTPSAEAERAFVGLLPATDEVEESKARRRTSIDASNRFACYGDDTPPPECTVAPDCLAGFVCSDGACVAAPPTER
jgi:hypothetical protein